MSQLQEVSGATPTTLFEAELNDRIEAAVAAMAAATTAGDDLMADAARNSLDDLVGLARRNGVVVQFDLSA